MDRNQALELIKMLSAIYPRTSLFADEENGEMRREIFIKILLPLNSETMKEVIEKEIEYNKFCPTPAELSASYKVAARNKEYRNRERVTDNCNICHGRGFVIEERSISGVPGISEYILHCECVAGTKWKYDGRVIEKDKSDFYIKSVACRLENEPVDIPKEWEGNRFQDCIANIGNGGKCAEPKQITRTDHEKLEEFYL